MHLVLVAAIWMFLGATSCSRKPASNNLQRPHRALEIYYLPFGIETLSPVDSKKIVKGGTKCEVSGEDDASTIVEILNSAVPAVRPEETFTDRRVRALVLEHRTGSTETVAIVENDGQISRNGAFTVFPNQAFERFKNAIRSTCYKN